MKLLLKYNHKCKIYYEMNLNVQRFHKKMLAQVESKFGKRQKKVNMNIWFLILRNFFSYAHIQSSNSTAIFISRSRILEEMEKHLSLWILDLDQRGIPVVKSQIQKH